MQIASSTIITKNMVASRGIQEESFPPLKEAMKMRRLTVEAIHRVPVGEVRGDAWFGLFDEVWNVMKGLRGSGRVVFLEESQSKGAWHPI